MLERQSKRGARFLPRDASSSLRVGRFTSGCADEGRGREEGNDLKGAGGMFRDEELEGGS